MRNKLILVACLGLSLWLIAASAGQAQDTAWKAPDLADLPPAPWRTGQTSWAASAPAEDVAYLELRVGLDTFVASQYPFDWESFGGESSVWFGSDPDLGHARALLHWNLLPVPPGGQFVGAAIYLPIVGQNPTADMQASAHLITSGWSGATEWHTQPSVQAEPFARLTIGRSLGWYWFDAGIQVQGWYSTPMTNYGVELRGPESSAHVIKGMWATEAGADAPVPTVVIAYLPDRTPPTCTMNPLPVISPGPVTAQWNCTDTQAGMRQTELQMRQPGGVWQTIGVFDYVGAYSYALEAAVGGNTYEFRVRGSDQAGNVSIWTSDGAAVTTVESTLPVLHVSGSASWMRIGGGVPGNLSLWAEDPGPVSSGVKQIDLAYADQTDALMHIVGRWDEMALQPGHRYDLWARPVDRAHNQGEWQRLAVVTAYVRAATGQVLDVRGQRLASLELQVAPSALNQPASDDQGRYTVYLGSADVYTLGVGVPSQMQLGEARIPAGASDARDVTILVGTAPNAMVNGRFADPLATGWKVEGGMATRQPVSFGGTNDAMRLGAPPRLTLDGYWMEQDYRGCMARGPDGSLHMAWFNMDEEWRSFTGTVYYAIRPLGTTAWSAPLALGPTMRGSTYYPEFDSCLLSVSPEGNVGLIYTLRGDPGQELSPVFRYRSATGEWGPIERLPPDVPLAMTMGAHGATHVVLNDIYHGAQVSFFLRYYLRQPDGRWEPGVAIAPKPHTNTYASLYIGPDGVRHLLWTGYDDAGRHVYHSSSRDGRIWSTAQALVSSSTGDAFLFPVLREGPDAGLFAIWEQFTSTGRRIMAFARLANGVWSQPQAMSLPPGAPQPAYFAVDVDPQGRWHLWLAPVYQYPYAGLHDVLLSGTALESLQMDAVLPMSSVRAAMISGGAATHLLRHVSNDPNYPGMYNPTASLVSVPHDRSTMIVAASQAVTVPSTTLPTLFWWSSLGHLAVESAGGQLTVGLTDTLGTWRELATITEASGAGAAWADLSPWRGQPVTLTFRFDPRGDATAWGWLDDVYLGGVPVNAGVSLSRSTALVRAGEDFGFDVTAANRRPMSLTVPLEATWPPGWAFVGASVAPAETGDGLARFELPADGVITITVRVTVTIPAGLPSSAAAIAAHLLPPLTTEDYTPADNAAELVLIVNGQPRWLPLLLR